MVGIVETGCDVSRSAFVEKGVSQAEVAAVVLREFQCRRFAHLSFVALLENNSKGSGVRPVILGKGTVEWHLLWCAYISRAAEVCIR